jgi:dihydroorotase
VAGGFTALVCMANTQPVNDDPSVTEYILDRARQESPARVYPVAAATRGLAGEVMTEMSALVEAGVVAFSDDGRTIMDSGVMRRVLEYSTLVRVPIITHAEDRTLVREGVVNEGPVSTRLGLPGNPAVAEVVHVARDILLAELTGAHLHVAHVSTAGAVDLIRAARERGVHVTAEVTPHHLRSPTRRRSATTPTPRWPRRCGRSATSRRVARGWPTAPSTRSRRTMRPTRCTRRTWSSRRRRRA